NRLPAACGNGARAGSEDFSPLEQRADGRMILELLERFERLQLRVDVIEPHDEADVHPVFAEVVQKTAAVGGAIERPDDGMLNQRGLDAPRRQLPEFFET